MQSNIKSRRVIVIRIIDESNQMGSRFHNDSSWPWPLCLNIDNINSKKMRKFKVSNTCYLLLLLTSAQQSSIQIATHSCIILYEKKINYIWKEQHEIGSRKKRNILKYNLYGYLVWEGRSLDHAKKKIKY